MEIFRRYLRWRHSRGFGVHSPYAFRIIERVIRPGGAARYGDARIRYAMQGAPRRWGNYARMLLRLVGELRPASVFIPTDVHAVFITALNAASTRTPLIREPGRAREAELICSTDSRLPLDVVLEAIRRPSTAVALIDLPEEWIRQIARELPEGVVFQGRDSIIAIHRPQTAKVVYTVNL
ncbi:MAG: hypothetical protein HDS24_05880 [Bacteroides sp.]|nr:hypothetical protein [Bacteroides sp.]